MEENKKAITVELAYALSDTQVLTSLEIDAGSKIIDVLVMQQVLETVDFAGVGIFGRQVELEHVLQHGDRIELYRKLSVDPKEQRRKRMRRAKKNNESKQA